MRYPHSVAPAYSKKTFLNENYQVFLNENYKAVSVVAVFGCYILMFPPRACQARFSL